LPRATRRGEEVDHPCGSDRDWATAFALRFDGRKRKHDAGEFMTKIVAKRLVDHLERAGFVVLKKPPAVGAATAWRGHER
jgi:hypothetical protein